MSDSFMSEQYKNLFKIKHKVRLVLALTTALMLSSCSSIPLEYIESQNSSERIKFLVMHYTAINYQQSVAALVDGSVSSHYLIPESYDDSYPNDELKIIQLVKETSRAWHAGDSFWQGRQDINDQSIGIEIVNVPDCKNEHNNGDFAKKNYVEFSQQLCFYPDYDPKQIKLLIELSKDILKRNPDISPTQVVGHSDIAPIRKNDPGPRFPWFTLYQAGIGAWYDNETSYTQTLVEFGALSMSMSIIPEVLWDPLTQNQKDVLAKKMISYGDGITVPSNWKFFNIFILSFFKDQGYQVNEPLLVDYLNKSLEHYRNDGWYNDNPAYDYYSMWAFQMYGTIWSQYFGNKYYPEIASKFKANFNDLKLVKFILKSKSYSSLDGWLFLFNSNPIF